MFLLLFSFAEQKRYEKISDLIYATRTYDVGIYEFTLNGAAGGCGCREGTQRTVGGNGASITALLRFTRKTVVNFEIGSKPDGDCKRYNEGGKPNGGNSGNDYNFIGNDASGSGGGMTAIKIGYDYILIAGGGSGGAGMFNGAHGGGLGYVLRVGVNGQIVTTKQKYLMGEHAGGKGDFGLRTAGSGGGGGWNGGKGGKASDETNPEVCGFGGTSDYKLNSIYIINTPTALDGRFTNNTGDGSVIVVQKSIRETVPENNRKPRKILVGASLYFSFSGSNLF